VCRGDDDVTVLGERKFMLLSSFRSELAACEREHVLDH
jgi:hypothetical protein